MLPDGYHTVLKATAPLSPGPAPADLHRPRRSGRPAGHDPRRGHLIIDTRTEEVVQAGMDNLMKGRTVS